MSDKDVVRHKNEIVRNLRKRGYTPNLKSIHIAAKMSPKDFKALRRAHPDVPIDQFHYIAGFSTDAKKELNNRE